MTKKKNWSLEKKKKKFNLFFWKTFFEYMSDLENFDFF